MRKSKSTKTITIKPEHVVEKWYLVDATGKKIGRLASELSSILLGKTDPIVAAADYMVPATKVVVINSDKLNVSERRARTKIYTRYSGYPSGLTRESLKDKMKKDSTFVVRNAVKGMLPHNSRGNSILRNLYVYAGSEHKHEAQQPEKLEINA